MTLDNEGTFPQSIVDVNTFGNNKFYVLTRSLYENQRDTYIIRYTRSPSSQIDFTNPIDYPIAL